MLRGMHRRRVTDMHYSSMPSLRLLPLLLCALGALPAQPASPPAAWAPWVTQLRAYVAADRIVGAGAVLVREGRIVARVNLGAQDQATGRAATDSTIYHWGSITKTLTAIAILQLRDRGRLSLDDRVTRYLPELRRVHDPFGMIDSITIRMLLSHSAGFRNGTWPYARGLPWEPFEPTSWEQLVAMMPYQELLFRPGSRYGYSNPAYVYLARIIEQLTGDPWDAYIHKNLFTPLGLTTSYFRSTPWWLESVRSANYTVIPDSVTKAVRTVQNPTEFDPGITTPNGGWNAPLDDLARYAAFLMNAAADRPRVVDAHLLSRATLEEMWTPVVPMQEGYEADPTQGMGLGFFVRGTGRTRVIGHTGFQAGFRSFLYVNPATKSAIVVVFNTTNDADPAREAYDRLHRQAIALVQGMP